MSTDLVELDDAMLARWPLPTVANGDKEARGRVLVVGGSAQVPGAVVLAGLAALRAGAGKLQVGAPASQHPVVASALPEALVLSLAESRGALAARARAAIARRAVDADAVVFGPGMLEARGTLALLAGLASTRTPLVVDAGGMLPLCSAPRLLAQRAGPVIATPHAGEMARLLGCGREDVIAAPLALAREWSVRSGVVCVLKGVTTHVVAPDGRAFVNRRGNDGLATSGSGDVLAGLIGGLLARGCDAMQAACWGVAVHARAGEALAQRVGPIGFLARELPGEVPALLDSLGGAAGL